jgi:hypothetical protein
MAIVNTILSTSDTDIHIVTGETAITVLYMCNTGASEVTVQLHAVPSGDTATDANKLYHDLAIPAGDTYIMESERLILETGDKLTGSASLATDITVTLSYKAI